MLANAEIFVHVKHYWLAILYQCNVFKTYTQLMQLTPVCLSGLLVTDAIRHCVTGLLDELVL